MNVAVLVSGRGGNLGALLAAIERGTCAARVCAVLSDCEGAHALEIAKTRGIPSAVVPAKAYAERNAWDEALRDAIAAHAPDLVVLAGFMRIVGSAVLERFAGRIINVHPALLPAFAGINAPAQAIAKRVTLSGCTVHVVDDGMDTGPILAQAAVPVLPDDDAAALHTRIQVAEHRLLPAVVHAIAIGALVLDPGPRFVVPVTSAELGSFVWPPLVD